MRAVGERGASRNDVFHLRDVQHAVTGGETRHRSRGRARDELSANIACARDIKLAGKNRYVVRGFPRLTRRRSERSRSFTCEPRPSCAVYAAYEEQKTGQDGPLAEFERFSFKIHWDIFECSVHFRYENLTFPPEVRSSRDNVVSGLSISAFNRKLCRPVMTSLPV